jgi:hypothetical protein
MFRPPIEKKDSPLQQAFSPTAQPAALQGMPNTRIFTLEFSLGIFLDLDHGRARSAAFAAEC